MRALLITLLVLLTLAAGAGAFVYLRYQRFIHTPFGAPEEKDVDIPSGTTLAELAHSLESAGVVSDGESFFIYARLEHADRNLKKGEYAFAGPLTPIQVLAQILQGRVKTYRITVAEGLRMDEIAPLFAQAGVADKDKLLAAMRDPGLLSKLGIPASTAEGFLFPDTYVEPKGRSEAAIVEEMVGHFRKAYTAALAQADPGVHLNEFQAATLASIVEKETGTPEERPHIACVFHNRLRLGMRLQTDPTVIYAQILKTGSFDGNITKKMLLEPHPYNTYTIVGLPPGPISNAGAASLQAALHPLPCKDLYFVARGNGSSVFCPDLRCQNANVEKYQVAPSRHAGR
jgi:UPF0755 protein